MQLNVPCVPTGHCLEQPIQWLFVRSWSERDGTLVPWEDRFQFPVALTVATEQEEQRLARMETLMKWTQLHGLS